MVFDSNYTVYLPYASQSSIVYSLNGTQWTALGNSIFNQYCYGIEYNGSNLWIAVGATINTVARSTDGITWTGLGTTITSSVGYGVVYANNIWLILTQSSEICRSTDGLFWTTIRQSIFTVTNDYKYVYSIIKNKSNVYLSKDLAFHVKGIKVDADTSEGTCNVFRNDVEKTYKRHKDNIDLSQTLYKINDDNNIEIFTPLKI